MSGLWISLSEEYKIFKPLFTQVLYVCISEVMGGGSQPCPWPSNYETFEVFMAVNIEIISPGK
jgi:hypothetical protein